MKVKKGKIWKKLLKQKASSVDTSSAFEDSFEYSDCSGSPTERSRSPTERSRSPTERSHSRSVSRSSSELDTTGEHSSSWRTISTSETPGDPFLKSNFSRARTKKDLLHEK